MTTITTETNYIDPLDQFIELRDSLKAAVQSTAIYKEALRKAAAAVLDNYVSTWPTPENHESFRSHVLSVGSCPAFDVLKEWCEVNDASLSILLAEHPYWPKENS